MIIPSNFPFAAHGGKELRKVGQLYDLLLMVWKKKTRNRKVGLAFKYYSFSNNIETRAQLYDFVFSSSRPLKANRKVDQLYDFLFPGFA